MGLYQVSISTEFSAAHIVHGYDGDCSRPHGHNWVVEVEVQTPELDPIGMAIDFRKLKKYTRDLVAILDHQMINEIPPFQTLNPTAENLASWFYQELKKQLAHPLRLQAVTIWETRDARVRYCES